MHRDIREIKGVGERVANTLMNHFGDQEKAWKALYEEEDFQTMLEAGLSLQKTSEIARAVISMKRDFQYSELLKTPEIREVFNILMGLLKGYPKTPAGKIGVATYYPTNDYNELQRRNEFIKDAKTLVGSLQGIIGEIDELLATVEALKKPRPNPADMIAVEDPQLYQDLVREMGGSANLILIDGQEDLEYLKDFDFVRYVGQNSELWERASNIENVEIVHSFRPEEIVPEIVIDFFSRNKTSILSAFKIARLTGLKDMGVEIDDLEDEITLIRSLTDKGIDWSKNPGTSRLYNALSQLSEKAEINLKTANERIASEIAKLSLGGGEILKILQQAQTGTIQSGFPKDFIEIIDASREEALKELSSELGIHPRMINGIYMATTHQLELDHEVLEEVKTELSLDLKREKWILLSKTALRLRGKIDLSREVIKKVIDLDTKIALGRFCIENNLHPPELNPELGVAFVKARNLFIKGRVQPINYSIGRSLLLPEHRAKSVVLTGANSGGKTSLLELLAQITLLTHMGLFVPAERAEIALFDDVYYFGKGKGNDAGAFETLLKSFEGLTHKSKKKRLILADEIEAITEPGAASKVLSGILEWFNHDPNTLIIIVTHLGEEIKEHLPKDIRIDGIEAKGLDENLNLIVDRNPQVGKIARSTPELILERLSKKTEQKEFYKNILKRFVE